MKKHLTKISGLIGAGILILCFQNCSDMVVQDGVIYQSSLAEYAKELDQKNLSILTTTDKIVRWVKPNNASYIDKGSFFSNRFSIIVAANRSANGQIASINSGVNSEELRIVSDMTTLRVYRISNATSYSYFETNVPATGEKMVIAATVGVNPQDLEVLINGMVQTSVMKTVGTPFEFSYIEKSITLAGAVREAVVYSVSPEESALSKGQLNVMSRYLASINSIPDVLYDPWLMNESGTPGGGADVDTAFIPVKAIIDNRCTSCHNATSGRSDLSNMTRSKLISRGWVVAKDPQGSKLYNSLLGSTGGAGRKDMPQGGSLSATDLGTISNWISGL